MPSIHAVVELMGNTSWLDYLQAFGPLFVGFFAGVIAWQNVSLQRRNHRLERERFKYNLLDRRHAVYDSFRSAIEFGLSSVTDSNQLSERIRSIEGLTGTVHFLFNEDIAQLFFDMLEHLWAMQTAKTQMSLFQGQGRPEYDIATEKWRQSRDDLERLKTSLPQRFSDYLRLSPEFL